MRRPRMALAYVVLFAGVAAGCAGGKALRSAQASFERAKTAGAEAKAPYEYYAAEAYLNQASHEAGERDKRQAEVFSKQSEFYSVKALEMAGGGAK